MSEQPQRLIDPRTGRPKDGEGEEWHGAQIIGVLCGLTALGCGLLGFVFCCMPFNMYSSIAALGLGVIALVLPGIPGRVMGGFGLFLALASLACMAAIFLSAASTVDRMAKEKQAQQDEIVRDALEEALLDLKKEVEENRIELEPAPEAAKPENAPPSGEPDNPLRSPPHADEPASP